jgi:hypothetical protein
MRSDRTAVESVGDERVLSVSGLFQARAVASAFQELAEDSDVLAVARQDD